MTTSCVDLQQCSFWDLFYILRSVSVMEALQFRAVLRGFVMAGCCSVPFMARPSDQLFMYSRADLLATPCSPPLLHLRVELQACMKQVCDNVTGNSRCRHGGGWQCRLRVAGDFRMACPVCLFQHASASSLSQHSRSVAVLFGCCVCLCVCRMLAGHAHAMRLLS